MIALRHPLYAFITKKCTGGILTQRMWDAFSFSTNGPTGVKLATQRPVLEKCAAYPLRGVWLWPLHKSDKLDVFARHKF